MRVEWNTFLPQSGARQQSAAPTLHQLWDAHIRNLEWDEASVRQHEALRRLVQVYDGYERGIVIRSVAERDAREALAADPDNLFARLLCACILDMGLERDAADSEQRFGSMKRVVDGSAPADTAKLYNDEFRRLWHARVSPHVRRPDVAASMVAFLSWGEIEEHIGILPRVRQRLQGLSDQLRRMDDHLPESIECDTWFARCAAMLLQNEADAATRLLCADLLGRDMDAKAAGAKELRQMRADFNAAADSASVDVFEQSGTARKTVAPSAYRKTLYSLLATIVCLVLAIAATSLLLLSLILAPVSSILARGNPPAVQNRQSPFVLRLALICAPTILSLVVVLPHFGRPRYFSDNWLFVAAMMLVAFGILAPIAVASLSIKPDRPLRRARIVAALVPAMFAAVFFMLPASIVAWVCRALDLSIGTSLVLGPCIVAAAAFALYISPAEPRRIAATAARMLAVNVLLALCIWGYHRAVDRQYQQAVVAGRFDEVAARLGQDWQQTYLRSALTAIGLPLN